MSRALCRLAVLRRHFATTPRVWVRARDSTPLFLVRRGLSSSAVVSAGKPTATVSIGDVSVRVSATAGALVPKGFLPEQPSQEVLGHLRFLMQKDKLRQHVLLCGPPGPACRTLALAYCELVNREVEVVSITRDTTDSDLKQRREMWNGTAVYADQAPVRAAVEGRILILEGLEKAERNLLPSLNNLLENAEMALDDGRFLVAHDRFDALVAAGETPAALHARGLLRCHPEFRVFAIGLPSPPFPGSPLDPPLRSRFQSRYVGVPSTADLVAKITFSAPSVPLQTVTNLAALTDMLAAMEDMHEALGGRLPHFPPHTAVDIARHLDAFPHSNVAAVFHAHYPYTVMPEFARDDTRRESVEGALAGFGWKPSSPPAPARGPLATVDVGGRPFAAVPSQDALVAAMRQDAAMGKHPCLIGGKGTGKSAIAAAFDDNALLFPLYADLHARELLMRRSTDPSGNTVWMWSPLTACALAGKVCVLDGLQTLPGAVVASLASLLQHGTANLPDGSRLVPAAVYDAHAEAGLVPPRGTPEFEAYVAVGKPPVVPDGGDSQATTSVRLLPVADGFRVVALAAPPTAAKSWLHPEVLSMFSYHVVPATSPVDVTAIASAVHPDVPAEGVKAMVDVVAGLHREAATTFADHPPTAAALQLSLRQQLRLVRHMSAAVGRRSHLAVDDVWPPVLVSSVKEALLEAFLPDTAKAAIQTVFEDTGLGGLGGDRVVEHVDPPVVDGGMLTVGGFSTPVSTPVDRALVPSPLFYDMPAHSRLLRDMLRDWEAGDRNLLLIGNQGVGKNKVADRFLQLLQRERQYVQLHRDTTVESITITPTIVDGVLVWEDSPLVTAATKGHVLLIDEADKAPLEVVSVLKSLVEDGQLLMPDGRRLVRGAGPGSPPDVIPVHPDFSIIVLANRPGFPFLGEAFFEHCGDVFSSHVVPHPDVASERSLVQAYAPGVPEHLTESLLAAFAELRDLNDSGVLSYPYSTREVVNTVRHLQAFPDDGLVMALENVLAFDSFDARLREQLAELFQRHGIPLQATPASQQPVSISLAKSDPLPAPVHTESWLVAASDDDDDDDDGAGGGGSAGAGSRPRRPPSSKSPWQDASPSAWRYRSRERPFAATSKRLRHFTEEKQAWRVFPEDAVNHRPPSCVVSSAACGDTVHVLTRSPFTLHSFSGVATGEAAHTAVDLRDALMPWSMGGLQPRHHTSPGSMNDTGAVMGALGGRAAVLMPTLRLVVCLDPAAGGHALAFPLPDMPLEAAPALQGMSRMLGLHTSHEASVGDWRLSPLGPHRAACWQHGGSAVAILDVSMEQAAVVPLPATCSLTGVHVVSPTQLLLRGDDLKWRMASLQPDALGVTASVQDVDVTTHADGGVSSWPDFELHGQAPPPHLTADTTARSGASGGAMLHTLLGVTQPGLVSVYSSLRDDTLPHVVTAAAGDGQSLAAAMLSPVHGSDDKTVAHLEVLDMETDTMRRIPVGDTRVVSVLPFGDGDMVTVTEDGRVSVVQAHSEKLGEDLLKWKQMLGVVDGQQLTLNSGLKPGLDATRAPPELDTPKHGKEDEKDHVGGNTWAGGTGGSDTAGLGGRGGPYRLDKGFPVHQISEELKREVSEEARAKAKAMAQDALKKRLDEIKLSAKQSDMYFSILETVAREINQLKVVLMGAQARNEERVWLKNQTAGDLDDARLVDGVAGDRNVFKRRGEGDKDSLQAKPIKLLFVLDCSASMYRFQGQDGRLQRMLELTTLIMESFNGLEYKFDVKIVGHSGDSEAIPLVDWGKPPPHHAARLQVLETMAAHAQFCMSGDTTLEATAKAIKASEQFADEECGGRYVFVVSDANLRRYGIPPEALGRTLSSNPKVKSYAVFIAGLGDEAKRTLAGLPRGRGFVCERSEELPDVFRKVFTQQFGM